MTLLISDQPQHSGNHNRPIKDRRIPRGRCPLVEQLLPFAVPVPPIPHDPYEAAEWGEYSAGEEPWKDYNLFTLKMVGLVLEENHGWLQDRPRDAGTVREVLFPSYETTSMHPDEIRGVIGDALWIAGYRPYGHGLDANWSLPTNE